MDDPKTWADHLRECGFDVPPPRLSEVAEVRVLLGPGPSPLLEGWVGPVLYLGEPAIHAESFGPTSLLRGERPKGTPAEWEARTDTIALCLWRGDSVVGEVWDRACRVLTMNDLTAAEDAIARVRWPRMDEARLMGRALLAHGLVWRVVTSNPKGVPRA